MSQSTENPNPKRQVLIIALFCFIIAMIPALIGAQSMIVSKGYFCVMIEEGNYQIRGNATEPSSVREAMTEADCIQTLNTSNLAVYLIFTISAALASATFTVLSLLVMTVLAIAKASDANPGEVTKEEPVSELQHYAEAHLLQHLREFGLKGDNLEHLILDIEDGPVRERIIGQLLEELPVDEREQTKSRLNKK